MARRATAIKLTCYVRILRKRGANGAKLQIVLEPDTRNALKVAARLVKLAK